MGEDGTELSHSVKVALRCEGREGGVGDASGRRRPAPVSLPCLNSNISIEIDTKWVHSQRETTEKRDDRLRQRNAPKRSKLKAGENGEEVWLGGLSSSEKRSGYALTQNLAYLAKLHGLEKLGFLTLTFRQNLTDPRKAQRKFNSLATNVLRDLFVEYICVVENQKRGAIHYHLVVVCKEDIRTGVSFDEIATGRYASASPELRQLWKELREIMPKYGFGRSELLPVKSTVSGICNYVGKYLTKASAYRDKHMKGACLIRYSTGWRVARVNFAWHSSGAKEWRRKLQVFGEATGCSELSELKKVHGRYWPTRFMSTLRILEEDGVSFEDFARELALSWDSQAVR